MKKRVLGATALMAAITITASSQAQSGTKINSQVASTPHLSAGAPNAARGQTPGSGATATDAGLKTGSLQNPASTLNKTGSSREAAQNKSSDANSGAVPLAPRKSPEVSKKALPASTSVSGSAVINVASSQVYRVGIRDVLDIKIVDNPTNESTLFTVLEGGVLDYPFAGNPIAVAGMTTNEIARMLSQRIKIFDKPKVVVSVRDFASHLVHVSGLVGAPGKKALRREAMPLYAVLAEAIVLPEAARASITRQGLQPIVIELKDPSGSATLVMPGDVIKVSGSPTEFFFIGGQIKSPGQKAYHAGLTLTQAILASGGTTTSTSSRTRVSRQSASGKLVSEVYNLRIILEGKAADPVLQKGDRIEVLKQD